MANGQLDEGRHSFRPRWLAGVLDFLAPGMTWSQDQLWLLADGLMGNIAGTFVNPFITPFALAFGAEKFHISILNSLPNFLGNLAQVPASQLVEASGRRKHLIMTSGIFTRVAWTLVLLLPFLFRDVRGVYALTLILTLAAIVGAVTTPAWTSLVSDLVPRGSRGRFFSARNVVMAAGALLSVNLAGRIVESGGFPRGYLTSFSIYLVLSWVSLYFFSRVRDVPYPVHLTAEGVTHRTFRRLTLDWQALRSPEFLTWIKIYSLFNLSVGIAGSLFGAYLIQDLHGTPMHLAYMSFAGTLTGMIGQRIWGPVSDRRGPIFAVTTSACLIAGVPLIWYFATGPWGGVLAETFSGLAWSGWNLCTFNLILEITPDDRRPSFVATGNLIGGISSFIAPLLGGYLSSIYTLRPLMLISSAGRLTTGLLLYAYMQRRRAELRSRSPAPRLFPIRRFHH